MDNPMSTIHSHLEDPAVFDPEALRVMSQAFHDTCNALHIFAGDNHIISMHRVERDRQAVLWFKEHAK